MLSLSGLHIRAALFRCLRFFFDSQGFLEVDTPIRQPVLIPESAIRPIPADGQFLQTSPEQCMKRILAQTEVDRVFQICRCFRRDERGRHHLEEFWMLEWYRKNADYTQLMADCEALLLTVASSLADYLPLAWCHLASQLVPIGRLTDGFDRLTVAEAFARYSPLSVTEALHNDQFDELLVEFVEPNLGRETPLILYDYPVQLASLAKIKNEQPTVAERFELYVQGVELANGFSELTDPVEQRQRFKEEVALITRIEDRTADLPERFLAELEDLDQAAGIALGVDRLLMLLLGRRQIEEVVSFTPADLSRQSTGGIA